MLNAETMETLRNNHNLKVYANGIITLSQLKNKVNMAFASLSLGRGFNESMESYLERSEDAMKRFKTLVHLREYVETNPTQEAVRQLIFGDGGQFVGNNFIHLNARGVL